MDRLPGLSCRIKAIMNALNNVCETLRVTRQLLQSVGFFWALLSPKAVLAARLLAAESQLRVCRQRVERKKAPGTHVPEASQKKHAPRVRGGNVCLPGRKPLTDF